MIVTTQVAVVIHDGAAIDDAVGAYPGTGLNDGPRHDLDTLFQHGVFRDNGLCTDDTCKAVAKGAIAGKQRGAQ
ncbi:hypothetical protein D3C73_1397250 [compost metagenome]